MMRSHDNPVLMEFRDDWRWVQNAPALIQEYIDHADHPNWTPEGYDAARPDQVAHARAVLGHMLGVRKCTGSDTPEEL